LIQYELADGRVLELVSPAPVRKTAVPSPGQEVNPRDAAGVI
jgi:hypothetical protein